MPTEKNNLNIPPEDTELPDEAGTVQELSVREKIELIKKENLTGRQLRMARRLAQKNGLQFTSDLDAVRALRDVDIDPFQSSNNLLNTAAGKNSAGALSNLPATVRRTSVADAMPIDDGQRQLEIENIRRELVLRRRRRIAALVTKLVCFVLIPTMLAGYYFYRVATPMYSSFTEFVIQKSDSPSLQGGGGGLFGGSLLATAQDSISVQGYLSSRDAMIRLDKDLGFKKVFQGDTIDALQRLDDDATNEATYKVYKKRVQIGFDPTEGIIKMEVITPSPGISYAYSKALIGYAEQKVDQLTQRMRKDQMQGADVGYEKAEVNFVKAQDRVVELQEKLGVLSPESEIAAQMSLIQQIESDLQQRELELLELLDNPRPNKTKLTVLENSIKSREGLAQRLRDEMTINTSNVKSMSQISAELQSAQTQLLLRQELLAASLVQLETARVEANRQTRYLSMAVSPFKSDEASYPKAFENTFLSALLFAGLFLMISLTASILKEQLTG